jgi:uncharacterized protein
MVRWVRGPEGDVAVDLKARAGGRGAWIHARPGCMARIQASLARSFRAPVKTTPTEAAEHLGQAAGARIEQLIGTLRRRGLAALGSTFAADAYRDGRGKWVLLAGDAQAAARESWVLAAVEAGRVGAWGDKARLGAIFERSEVAVLTILDERLAKGIFGAIAMALLAPKLGPRGNMEHQPSQGSAAEVE